MNVSNTFGKKIFVKKYLLVGVKRLKKYFYTEGKIVAVCLSSYPKHTAQAQGTSRPLASIAQVSK